MTEALINVVNEAFANQRELNHRLKPDWVDQGWAYYRAIWREAAEIFDHTNWAWWSAATYDKPLSQSQKQEVHIELCDILHFGLSLDIVKHVKGGEFAPTTADRAKEYVYAFEQAKGGTGTLEACVEALMIDALLVREFNIKKFACACNAVGLSLTGLMAYYFAKSALNQFRWDNGYSLPKGDPNKYVKMWKFPEAEVAWEDNTYLIEYMETEIADIGQENLAANISSGAYVSNLYNTLKTKYALIER